MTAVERSSTLEGYGIAVALSPEREKSRGGRKKVMQIEKGTKLLKRVWKAVVYIDLVIAAGALLFLSQYFSWDVFMSKFYQQATAATPPSSRDSLHNR
jgi:hypothetical protein